MKKKSISVAIAMSLAATTSLFADHDTQQRGSCVGLPKYKAKAIIHGPTYTFSHWNSDTGCGYATAAISSDGLDQGKDGNGNINAYEEVYIGNDGFNEGGWAYNGWSRGEVVESILPSLSFSPIVFSQNEKNISRDGYKGDGIVFDEINRTITIKNLTAFLNINSKDLRNDFATLEFKIFSEKIVNGESVPVQTLWNAKFSILNGELALEGDFKASDFSNTSVGNNVYYSLNKTTKVIHIDESVDFKSLVVDMAGDNGNLGNGVTEKFAPHLTLNEINNLKDKVETASDFNFDIKKGENEIKVDITKNTTNASISEVAIVSFDNKSEKVLELSNVSGSQVVNTNNLAAGSYYLRYLINGNYYMKKFIL
jgi:hypothetical protein